MTDNCPKVITNIEVICSHLGVTSARISQLTKLGIIVKEGKNAYNLLESSANYIRYLQAGNSGASVVTDGDEVTGDDYHRHRARLYKAKADTAELEASLLRGSVHSSESVEAVWDDLIASARAKLLALPNRLAGSLQGLTDITLIKSKLEDAVTDSLLELAEYDPNLITLKTIPEDIPTVEASSEANG